MFEPMNFVENLSYMGKGMLGINSYGCNYPCNCCS